MEGNTNQSSTNSNMNTSSSAGSSGQNQRMLTTMYNDRESAEKAYATLQSRGYTDKDINVLMSDETRDKHFAKRHDDDDTALGNKAMENAGIGSAIGGTLGAVAAAIAAIGSNLILPGIGLVVAGPLAAGLAGAGAGGLTVGLIGALVGSGIPDEKAKEYEAGIKQGGIVMGVNPRHDDDVQHLGQHGFR